MRRIYLVRHGETQVSFGKKLCLGQKNMPLSESGEKQALNTASFFKDKEITAVFTSPLKRTYDTAAEFAKKLGMKDRLQAVEALKEINLGAWDGLEFAVIKERYPEDYENRGASLATFRIPGAETFSEAGDRFARGFADILNRTSGNILIVSHAGVIKTLLCRLTGTSLNDLNSFNIPYASITELECEACSGFNADNLKDSVKPVNIGFRPSISLTLSEVAKMCGECGTGANIVAHMEMVADTAMNIIGYDRGLVKSDVFDPVWRFEGSTINTRDLYFAALVHDVKRADGRKHAATGADYIEKWGFKTVADIVRLHDDPAVYHSGQPVSEAEILYLADKMVKEDVMVTIEERFSESRAKCTTPEAMAAHEARYKAALGIMEKVGY